MRVNGDSQLLVIVAYTSKNLSGGSGDHEFYIFLNETLNRKVYPDFLSDLPKLPALVRDRKITTSTLR